MAILVTIENPHKDKDVQIAAYDPAARKTRGTWRYGEGRHLMYVHAGQSLQIAEVAPVVIDEIQH
ncbi:MAG: hypothetical protein ABSB19_17315 [Methylomonas sp.]|jgi:hypothetical protein